MHQVFDMLSRQLDVQLARWNDISTRDVAAFNDLVRKENIPAVSLSH